MSTRKERVILDLDANPYIRGLAKASTSTSAFVKQLDTADSRMSNLVQTALALTPALVPIGAAGIPAIAGLTSQLGFAAAGAGVMALAFSGVGDALKAVNEYQLDPTTENLEEMRAALETLGPAGREFVAVLQDLRPEMQELQSAAQAGLFPGMTEGIDELMARLPEVERIITEIAEASGQLAAEAGAALSSDRFDDFFNFLATEARDTLVTFGRTVGNVFEGVTNVWMALDPLSDQFGEGLLNFAQDFAEATRNLDESAGFQEFLAYVSENTPAAVDALVALGETLVALVKAAAPVGAVTLPIIEALAKVLTTIVESPAGPALIAAAAGLSAVSRAVALFNAANGSALVGMLGGVSKQAPAAASGLARFNATVSGLKTAAPIVGTMALAFSDLDDKIGVSNTAMFAMAGALAGPVGVAVGGAVGAILDLAAANDDLQASIRAADAAIESMDLARMKAELQTLERETAEQIDQNFALSKSIPVVGEAYSWFADETDKGAQKQKELRDAIALAEQATRNQANAVSNAARALDLERQALEANIEAMREKRNLALQAENAEIAYQAAIDEASQSLKDNGKTLDITTDKGRANRQALLNLAGAWNNQSDAVKNSKGAHKDAIDTFVRVAGQMGMNADKARAYARELFEIPTKRETKIHAEAGQAFRVINGVTVALRNLDGTVSTTYIRTVRSEHMANRLAAGRAFGGKIPGSSAHKRADDIPIMATAGEYMHQVDAVRHYGIAAMDAINNMRIPKSALAGYAYGGQIGGPVGLAGGGSVDRAEILRLRQEIRDLMKELAEEGKKAIHGLERRRTQAELREARRELKAERVAPLTEILEGLRGVGGMDVAGVLGRDDPRNPTASGIRSEVGEFRRAIREAGGVWTKRMDRLGDAMVRNAAKIDRQERAIEAETARREKLTAGLEAFGSMMDSLRSEMASFGSAVAGNFLSDPFNQSRTVTVAGRVDPGLQRRLSAAEARLIGLRSSPNADSVAAAAEASVLLPQIQAMRAEVERQSQPIERAISGHQLLTETLEAEAQGARDFLEALRGLRGRGLSTDVLSSLATSGDLGTAQGLLAGGQTAIQDINRLWNERAAAAAEVAAFATQEVYGQQQAQLQAHMDRMRDAIGGSNDRLERIESRVENAGDRIVAQGKATAQILAGQISAVNKRIDNLPKQQEDNRRARGRRK